MLSLLTYFGISRKSLFALIIAGLVLGLFDATSIYIAGEIVNNFSINKEVLGLSVNTQAYLFITFLIFALIVRVLLLSFILQSTYLKESVIGLKYVTSYIKGGVADEVSDDTIIKDVITETEVATKAFLVPLIQYYIALTNVLVLVAFMLIYISLVSIFIVLFLAIIYIILGALSRPILKREGELRQRFLNSKHLSIADLISFKDSFNFYDVFENFKHRYVYSTDRLAQSQAKSQLIARTPRYFLEMLMIGGLVIVIVSRKGVVNFEEIGVLFIFILKLIPAAQLAFNNYALAKYNRLSIDRLQNKIAGFNNTRIESVSENSDELITVENLEIDLEGVNITYPDMSFSWKDAEIYRLVGESGCGKSTLLRAISGLQKVTSGDINSGFADNIIYVPQHSELLNLSVTENIRLFNSSKELNFVLDLLHLDVSILNQERNELSGGQVQRIILARAILSGKKCLLLDEALSGISESLESDIMKKLVRELGLKIIYISHRNSLNGLSIKSYSLNSMTR
jgi:ABC-type bacteriocin/lantibiotic exporter with double-glycine peptidase domain